MSDGPPRKSSSPKATPSTLGNTAMMTVFGGSSSQVGWSRTNQEHPESKWQRQE